MIFAIINIINQNSTIISPPKNNDNIIFEKIDSTNKETTEDRNIRLQKEGILPTLNITLPSTTSQLKKDTNQIISQSIINIDNKEQKIPINVKVSMGLGQWYSLYEYNKNEVYRDLYYNFNILYCYNANFLTNLTLHDFNYIGINALFFNGGSYIKDIDNWGHYIPIYVQKTTTEFGFSYVKNYEYSYSIISNHVWSYSLGINYLLFKWNKIINNNNHNFPYYSEGRNRFFINWLGLGTFFSLNWQYARIYEISFISGFQLSIIKNLRFYFGLNFILLNRKSDEVNKEQNL